MNGLEIPHHLSQIICSEREVHNTMLKLNIPPSPKLVNCLLNVPCFYAYHVRFVAPFRLYVFSDLFSDEKNNVPASVLALIFSSWPLQSLSGN